MTDSEATTATDTAEHSKKNGKPPKQIKDLTGKLYDGDVNVRWRFDPDEVFIVGADTLDDEDDPLNDKGATSKLDEAFVKSVGSAGIQQAVLVTPREHEGVLRPFVVAGRNRVRGLRQAKKQKLLANKELYFVPADSISGTPEELKAAKHRENFVRVNRDTMDRARAALDMSKSEDGKKGQTNAEIALTLGVSVSTVENLLALGRASKPIVEALAKGQLPPTAAYKLAKLPAEKQADGLKETLKLASGNAKGGRAKVGDAHAGKRRARGDAPAASGRPGIGKIQKILDAIKEELKGGKEGPVYKALSKAEPVDFLRWIVGDVTDRVLPAEIRDLVKS